MDETKYPDTMLFIDGRWVPGHRGATLDVLNPASGEVIGNVAAAEREDLERALSAAEAGCSTWSRVSAFDRYRLMRRAAENFRHGMDEIARLVTIEQGKPLGESLAEAQMTADLIDWFAEEGRRSYGRVIPSRAGDIRQIVVAEPVGPVAGFSPWNAPISTAVRKIAGALAAGCSIILKGPEETPACCAALVRAFENADLPSGVLNLVFGNPAAISEHLIPHPVIRKVSFTGSTAVGRRLAALAGQHLKRITLELGGHAPAIVFGDADLDHAIRVLSGNKFRNGGQVCVAPTRFLVHESVYDRFVDGMVDFARSRRIGSGLEAGIEMGPLANARRLDAVKELVADAQSRGATVRTGGRQVGNKGFFFEPTVLTEVPREARIMNEEPFGPVAPVMPFETMEEAVAEANRLPLGLAAYAYTRSDRTSARISAAFQTGMVAINHHGLGLPELPFGGVRDSGYGTEGGADALGAFLNHKLVTHAGL
jgi:succinate-semialdehyde dehydrogenase / glutarate-semialdehyde dehydrogenase